MNRISRNTVPNIVLIILFPFSFTVAQTDSSWQQLSTKERSANAFPIIMYDSDIGFGFGGKMVLKNRYQKQEAFDVTVFASTKGEQWYAFQFSAPDYEFRQGQQYALSLDARIEWDKLLKTNYFGIGNFTEDNNFQFPSEFFRFATILGHAFSSHWIIELGYQFSHYSVYGYDSEWETITDETPGAGQSNVSGFSSGIRFDSRDSHINPTRGVRIYLKTGLADKTIGSDWNFVSYRLESNFYANLYRRKHILATRFWSQQIDGTAPVQELSMIGDGWTARGYKAGRFLDKAMMLTSLEYRFPLFKKLGGVLFADAGRVSPKLKIMNLNDWHSDWGWGLRYFLQTFIVRFDMGSSKEGTRIFFNFGHVF
jgi:outer membrane protein assembly factor BamA